MPITLRLLMVWVAAAGISGCSFLFGDTFQDRADNYLTAEEYEVIRTTDDQPLNFVDAYPIPPSNTQEPLPEEFETPRPLLFIEEQEEDVTRLSEYQSDALAPTLDQDGAGTQILRLGLPFAPSWSAVTEAISASSLNMTDLNRSTGTYYLKIEQPDAKDTRSWWDKVWGEELKTSAVYLLKMNRSLQGVYLSLLTDADNLADEKTTNAVLTEIQQQLEP